MKFRFFKCLLPYWSFCLEISFQYP